MAWVNVDPITPEAQEIMMELRDTIRSLIRQHLGKVWQVPEGDRIVNLRKCIVLDPDPVAISLGELPDIVISINTSDPLQHLAKALCEAIKAAWNDEIGDQLKAEVWVGFFHTWGRTSALDSD